MKIKYQLASKKSKEAEANGTAPLSVTTQYDHDSVESRQNRSQGCCSVLTKKALLTTVAILFVLILSFCVGSVLCSLFGGSITLFRLTGPLHAQCKVNWNFGSSCQDSTKMIIDQIGKWNGTVCSGPNGDGEKCRYALVKRTDSPTNTILTATHTTPVHEYVDDLTFTLTSSGSECQVQGYSTSETWYAHLDFGTNYCNLHNLITGSGLDKTVAYSESTSDAVCTQYSSADCTKY